MKPPHKNILDYFFLLRIPLLAPVWTILILGWVSGSQVTSLGGFICDSAGGLAREALLWTALAGFSLVVASIYVVNQIMDIESDRINHKLFFLPQGIIPVSHAWILAIGCALLGIGIAVFLFDAAMTVIFVICLVLGALYNLPPFSLKNRAIGGVIANFLGHGVLTYLVGWYAIHCALGLRSDWTQGIIAALSPGFANAAVYITTTIADEQGDRSTGKCTFCVRYGSRASALTAAAACGCSLAGAFLLPHHQWVMIGPALASLAFFIFLAAMPDRTNAFSAFKWPVFLLSASVAAFVPLYGVLIFITFFGSRWYYRWRFDIDYPTFKAQ